MATMTGVRCEQCGDHDVRLDERAWCEQCVLDLAHETVLLATSRSRSTTGRGSGLH